MRATGELTTVGLSDSLVLGDGTEDEMCLESAFINLVDLSVEFGL